MVFDENFSTRPTTLLGQYLAEHKLTEKDFKAFATLYLANRLPQAQLYLSLLYRWQREQPQSTLPLELAAKLPGQKLAAELEIHYLAPLRDQMFRDAVKDPELLQLYHRCLMQTYRAQRSIFYTPPSVELQAVLARLTMEGRLVEGEFRPGGTRREWTDAGVLRMLRRRSLAKLRQEIEPVDQAILGRFTTTLRPPVDDSSAGGRPGRDDDHR